MWQYNHNSELYHFGVKGMKWGVRRYQKKDGSLTSAGKKRYKANTVDKLIYGEKGAKRIAERRNKGDSAVKARVKEAARQVGTRAAVSAGFFAGSLLVSKLIVNGGASNAAKKVVNAGKNVADSYWNVSVLDKNGQVLRRYHQNVNAGKEAVEKLMLR